MWPFKRKVRQRRLEVRKGIPSSLASKWKRFRQASGLGAVLLAAAFFVVLALMDALPPEPLPYRAGQYVPSDINARVAFRVLSKELQAGLQRKVENTAPPVFKLNTALIDEITGALKNLPEQLKATTQPSNLDKSLQKQFAFTADSAQKIGRALAEPARGRAYHEHVEQLRRSLSKNYIVRSEARRP